MSVSIYVDASSLNDEVKATLAKAGLPGGKFVVGSVRGIPQVVNAMDAAGKQVALDEYTADRLLIAVDDKVGEFRLPGQDQLPPPPPPPPSPPKPKPERKDFPNEVEYFKAAAKHAAGG